MEIGSLLIVPVALDEYPKDIEAFASLTNEIYQNIIPSFIKEYSDTITVTAFVTDNVNSVADAIDIEIDRNAPGLVVLVKDLSTDAIFYVAAMLKADMLVRQQDKEDYNGDLVYAVWERSGILGAITLAKGSTEYEILPQEAVMDIVPHSLSWDQSTAN